ncbi:hypothetical protein ACWFMI_10780 [Nocardiopsis terrae]
MVQKISFKNPASRVTCGIIVGFFLLFALVMNLAPLYGPSGRGRESDLFNGVFLSSGMVFMTWFIYEMGCVAEVRVAGNKIVLFNPFGETRIPLCLVEGIAYRGGLKIKVRGGRSYGSAVFPDSLLLAISGYARHGRAAARIKNAIADHDPCDACVEVEDRWRFWSSLRVFLAIYVFYVLIAVFAFFSA